MTLRRVQKGWKAQGLLLPLWGRVGGRDGLAKITGIPGTTLSAYNSGNRPLGLANAERIASALGVSLAELGAPEELAEDPASLSMLDRLAALEAGLHELALEVRALAEEVAGSRRARPRTGRGGRS